MFSHLPVVTVHFLVRWNSLLTGSLCSVQCSQDSAYAFVDKLAAMKPSVKGASNNDRYTLIVYYPQYYRIILFSTSLHTFDLSATVLSLCSSEFSAQSHLQGIVDWSGGVEYVKKGGE